MIRDKAKVNDKGQLYVTHRGAGDVLMLTDNNSDGKFDHMTLVADFLGDNVIF